jgi:glycerol-3-phosphate dehydrogenase
MAAIEMKRDFSRLENGPFDLLVIGGGIYGAWAAYDAALRGLSVALVEKTDWAAGTSSASSKLIHGGLRYLKSMRFNLVRKSLHERRLLTALAPHRIQPLDFVLPVFSNSKVGRLQLKAGLWLYDRLAGADQPVDPHRYLNGAETRASYDFINSQQLKGAFIYGDCLTDDARLTLEIVAGAMRAGAVAVNGATATRLIESRGKIRGARITDRETARSVTVKALVTLDCTGPWMTKPIDSQLLTSPPEIRLAKGVHLVMPALPTQDAFILPTELPGRVVFLIPWYGLTLLGTTDTDYPGDPDHAWVEPRDITYLLSHANRLFPQAPWEERQIIGSFAGLRALPASDTERSSDVTREWSLCEPAEGLLASVGGKLTSARTDAAETIDRVLGMIGHGHVACSTANQPLPWCPAGPFKEWAGPAIARGFSLGLDEVTAEQCVHRYGDRVDELYDVLVQAPELARRILPQAPFCMAEIVHAIDAEMARSLEDIFRRRIPLTLVARLSRETLHDAARLAADRLQWNQARLNTELNSLVYTRRPRTHTN